MADEPSGFGAPWGGAGGRRGSRAATPFGSKAKIELDTSKLKDAKKDVDNLKTSFDDLFKRLDKWAKTEAKAVAAAFNDINQAVNQGETVAGRNLAGVSAQAAAGRDAHTRQAQAVAGQQSGNPSAAASTGSPSTAAPAKPTTPNGGSGAGGSIGRDLAVEARQFLGLHAVTTPVRYFAGLQETAAQMDAVGAQYQFRMGRNLNGGIQGAVGGFNRSLGPQDELAAASNLTPWAGTSAMAGMQSTTRQFIAANPGMSAEAASGIATGMGAPDTYSSLRRFGVQMYGRGGRMRASNQVFSDVLNRIFGGMPTAGQAAYLTTPGSRANQSALTLLGGNQELVNQLATYATQSAAFSSAGGTGMYNANRQSHRDLIGLDENIASAKQSTGASQADLDFKSAITTRGSTLWTEQRKQQFDRFMQDVVDNPIGANIANIANALGATGIGSQGFNMLAAAMMAGNGAGAVAGGVGALNAVTQSTTAAKIAAVAGRPPPAPISVSAGSVSRFMGQFGLAAAGNRLANWGTQQAPGVEGLWDAAAWWSGWGPVESGMDWFFSGEKPWEGIDSIGDVRYNIPGVSRPGGEGDAIRGRGRGGARPCHSCRGSLTGGVGDGIRRGGSGGGLLPHNEPSNDAVTKLSPELSKRLGTMFEAYSRENPHAAPLFVESGWRDESEQRRLRQQYCTNPEDPNSWCSRPVAMPGQSNHQRGLAADIGPGAAYGWLRANAQRFGLAHTVPSEDWHLEAPGATPMTAHATGGEMGDQMAGSKSYGGGGAGAAPSGGASTLRSGFASIFRSFMSGPPGAAGGGGGGAGAGSSSTGSSDASGGVQISGQGAALAAKAAYAAGFRGEDLQKIVAIAGAESGFDPNAEGDHGINGGPGPQSFGLWQIHVPAHGEGNWTDPAIAAAHAHSLVYNSGNSWDHWSVHQNNRYLDYMDAAAAGIAEAGVGDAMRGRRRGGGGGRGGAGGGGVIVQNPNFTVHIEKASEEEAERFVRMVMSRIEEQAALSRGRGM